MERDTNYYEEFKNYFKRSRSYSVDDLKFDDLPRDYFFSHSPDGSYLQFIEIIISGNLYPYGIQVENILTKILVNIL